MGLFSKFGKNKQQSPEDSGYYRAADDRAITERARSKRASSADSAGATRGRARKDAPDPVLPEKKRARRRLVGAIALALAVAIGLPMVLDSEPKPLNNDIAIQIPPRDKPDNSAKAAADDTAAEDAAVADAKEPEESLADAKTAQAEALDQSEEIVEPEDHTPVVAAPPRPLPKLEERPAPVKTEPPKVAKLEVKPEPKPKHEAKVAGWDEPKVEPKKLAEARPEPKKPEPKAEARPEAKPVPKTDDAARALALLEGKAAPAAAPADSGRYVIQVAALAAKDKVEELQGKLRDAGIKSFTQKSPSGELTRVKVGPFGSREEAEKAKAKLQKIGLSGSLSPA
ncbi:SPOR domain-containing protein [Pseudoduganella sp. SL102]|uniref:SPOR domain-containing protein n=1 Tax=Pseudoduganella sp. SL102 TaxID=2995154 RepID=UPI00248C7FB5|nr:SPOR domain-containing protein [Pseudoduganella sp. SL102]WBS01612.1 SPOR domain-containing protein [Pseudoduganella sp. SL102]